MATSEQILGKSDAGIPNNEQLTNGNEREKD